MAPKKDNKRKAAAASSDNESDKETKKTKETKDTKKDTKAKDTKEKDTKDTKDKDTKDKDTKKDGTPKKTRQSTKDKTKESKSKEPKDKKDKKDKKEKSSDPVTVERGEISVVLEHLTSNLVKELLDGNNVKKPKTAKKSACIAEVLELAAKKGQAVLFSSLEKEDLKSALETLSKEELDHDNKSKMLIEVKKYFNDMKHQDFFKALSKETLVRFAAALEFEEEDATKEDLEVALEEEILIAGLRQIFATMTKDYIVDVAKTLNIPHSGTKKKLENSILAIAYPHLSEEDEDSDNDKKDKKKEDKKINTDISKISKDSNFEDLYQYYTKDLQEFVDKNGLKKAGTKKELVNRILQWFKDPEAKGVKPLKPGDRIVKKKKKSEAQKKKEAKEKREKKKAEEEASGEKKDTKKDDKKEDKKAAKKDDKKDDKKDEKKDDKKEEKASDKKEEKKDEKKTEEKKGKGKGK